MKVVPPQGFRATPLCMMHVYSYSQRDTGYKSILPKMSPFLVMGGSLSCLYLAVKFNFIKFNLPRRHNYRSVTLSIVQYAIGNDLLICLNAPNQDHLKFELTVIFMSVVGIIYIYECSRTIF